MDKGPTRTRNLTYSGLFIALGLLVPQVFHMLGGNTAGGIFLPMHLPVLISGLLLGPAYGTAVGVLSPLLSALLTGMPPLTRLPFMVLELLVYGLVSGLCAKRLFVGLAAGRKHGPWLRDYASLLAAQTAGRLAYAISLLITGNLLHLAQGGAALAWTSTLTGLPGIILQWLLVPPLVRAIEKGASFRHGLGHRQNKLR